MEERPKKKLKSIFSIRMYSDFLDLSDAKLKSEDGLTFDIHRYQLAKSCEYFYTMFCAFQNKDRHEFTVPGISGVCLGEILRYIYTGDVPVSEWNIADLLVASDYLLLPNLYVIAKGSLEKCLTTENAFRLFAAAQKLNDEDISQRSFRFIQVQFEVVANAGRQGLTDLPAEVLHKILSNKSICVRSESTVWHVIVDWIKGSFAERLRYVPHLLTSLARKELDEDLSAEMLQHETIKGNQFLSGLNDGINSKFSTNLDIVLNYLDRFDGMDYRIPPELHVIIIDNDEEAEPSTLYVTYDENMDLWRRIGEVNFYAYCAIPIGYNVFMFGEEELWKFDLTNQQFSLLRHFVTFWDVESFSFVGVDGKLCILGKVKFNSNGCEYGFHMYNPDMDTWSCGACPTNITHAKAVEVSKKIYVVGHVPNRYGMIAQVFDVETFQWSILPAPTYRFERAFCLVALRECLYLFGRTAEGSNSTKVEIFDTNANAWTQIAEIPHYYGFIEAVVWKDQIILFDRDEDWDDSESTVCWNEEKNCWETFDKSSQIDFNSQIICTIRDLDSVAKITRRSRNLGNHFVKSCFV